MIADKARFFIVFIGVFTALITNPAHAAPLESVDATAASVLAYMHTQDDAYPDQFKAHIESMEAEHIKALSLETILQSHETRLRLPARTVAFTFDNPDQSFFEEIWPTLRDKNIPFAVFISPRSDDKQTSSWMQIKKILSERPDLITIGLTLYGEVSPAQLNSAVAMFREKLGVTPQFFAYGSGLYNEQAVNALKQAGFKAAFGQQSGVTSYLSDRYRLPRFTMTEDVGDVERFVMASASLPFPAADIQPLHNLIDTDSLAVGFTALDVNLKNLSCFSSQDGKIIPNILADKRVELRIPYAQDTGKIRINCTIPVPSKIAGDAPRYRWLGFLFIAPEKTGTDDEIELNETGLEP